MGIIRGILLVFVAVLLFLSLIAGNVLWTLNFSLDYNNVKPEMRKVLETTFENQDLETIMGDNLEIMQLYCQSNSEYVFDSSPFEGSFGYSLTLPCVIILEGSDAIVNYISDDFVDEFYYKDYDCAFWNCFDTAGPFFLVSQKAKDYWNSKCYFILLGSLILLGALFLLAHKKSNAFIIAGSLLIVASLPFSKLDWVLNFFSDKIVLGLLGIFFTEAYTVFVISLVAGILLLALGIISKIFGIGFGISDFFSRFSKKPGKEKQGTKPPKSLKKSKDSSIKEEKEENKSEKKNKNDKVVLKAAKKIEKKASKVLTKKDNKKSK